MATQKIKDICVKVGEYQSNGETKGRYENVGSVFQKDDGSTFMTLKRTFNPAGVVNPDHRDSVILSEFDVKQQGQQQQQGGFNQQQQPQHGFNQNKPAPPPQGQPQGSFGGNGQQQQGQPQNQNQGGFNGFGQQQ